jgi:hypothetical protein
MTEVVTVVDTAVVVVMAIVAAAVVVSAEVAGTEAAEDASNPSHIVGKNALILSAFFLYFIESFRTKFRFLIKTKS